MGGAYFEMKGTSVKRSIVNVCAFSAAVVCCAMSAGGDDQLQVDFNRDVRPILSNHCFQCHGPDADKREADLRLDLRSGGIASLGGIDAIVPGRAVESELIVRVRSTEEDICMPPAEHGEPLTQAQISLLTRWIDQGAVYDQHWSLQPIVRPNLPQPDLPKPDLATARQSPGDTGKANPIDAFIHRRLAEEGIESSPPASRESLIRRVSLDLLGLPPTIGQLDAFVNDRRPGAYDRMVDRMLASERFGERWGRHWLDQRGTPIPMVTPMTTSVRFGPTAIG